MSTDESAVDGGARRALERTVARLMKIRKRREGGYEVLLCVGSIRVRVGRRWKRGAATGRALAFVVALVNALEEGSR